MIHHWEKNLSYGLIVWWWRPTSSNEEYI